MKVHSHPKVCIAETSTQAQFNNTDIVQQRIWVNNTHGKLCLVLCFLCVACFNHELSMGETVTPSDGQKGVKAFNSLTETSTQALFNIVNSSMEHPVQHHRWKVLFTVNYVRHVSAVGSLWGNRDTCQQTNWQMADFIGVGWARFY